MNLQPVGWKGLDRIDLSKGRDKRRALVKTVMNLHVPQNVRNFWTTDKLLAFQEVPCCMQLVF